MVALIGGVRAVRAELNVPAGARLAVTLHDADAHLAARAEAWREPILRMARAASLETSAGPVAKGAAQVPLPGAIAAVPVADVIDLAAERQRLAKALATAEADIARVRARLDNPQFRAKAGAEAIEEQDEKLAEATSLRAQLAQALERIA